MDDSTGRESCPRARSRVESWARARDRLDLFRRREDLQRWCVDERERAREWMGNRRLCRACVRRRRDVVDDDDDDVRARDAGSRGRVGSVTERP